MDLVGSHLETHWLFLSKQIKKLFVFIPFKVLQEHFYLGELTCEFCKWMLPSFSTKNKKNGMTSSMWLRTDGDFRFWKPPLSFISFCLLHSHFSMLLLFRCLFWCKVDHKGHNLHISWYLINDSLVNEVFKNLKKIQLKITTNSDLMRKMLAW